MSASGGANVPETILTNLPIRALVISDAQTELNELSWGRLLSSQGWVWRLWQSQSWAGSSPL
jgi:hypothetical protein